MSIKKTLFTSSIWNALGHIFLLFASFFSLPMLVAALGTAQFGQYLLLVGIPALAGLFDLGFGNGSLYYLSRNPSPTIWRKVLTSNLIATIPMLIGAILITHYAIGSQLVIFMVILVLVNQLSDIILILAQSTNTYSIFNLKVIVVGIGNTLVSAYVANATGCIENVLFVQVFFHLIVIACLAFWLKNKDYDFHLNFDKDFSLKILRYGLTTLGSSVAGQLQAQTAKYYLNFIFSSATTAIYGLALSLVQKGLTLIQVTGRSFFATSANLDQKSESAVIKKIFLSSVVVVLIIGIFTVLATFLIGSSILTWWLGDARLAYEVYEVLKVLSVWFVAVSLTPLTSYIGLGTGQAKLVSLFAISSAVVEIVLMFILTPRLGLVGPAYAALVSSYLHTPPFLYLLWKKLNAKV